MSDLFLFFFNRAIAAGWLLAVVLLLRPLLRKCPAWLRCALWALVAVRLVCPVSLESALSLVPSAETLSAETVRYDSMPQLTSGIPALNTAVNGSISAHFAASPAASANPLYIWTFFAGCVWAAGMFALLFWALISFLRTKRRLREAVPLGQGIFQGDAVRSPFILGLFRPRIYLPSGLDGETQNQVLAHERAHLSRRDHWWKALGFCLLALYWFQPLLWAGYVCFCRDLELACDERVVRTMTAEQRKIYLHALVDCSAARRTVLSCPLAFGEIGVKARVRRILRYKKPAFWLIVAAVVFCAALAVCFLTDPVSQPDAGDSTGDLPPMLVFHDQRYVAPYKPVTYLPSGYQLAGQLSEAQSGDTGLVGHDYYLLSDDDPDTPADLYVWGEYGTPVSVDEVDSAQRTWAYLRWIPVEVDTASRRLTLDDVLFFADEADALRWEDFDPYPYSERGSGLCIYVYEIDARFALYIGGANYPDAMYFQLCALDGTEAFVDLREGRAAVSAFLAAHMDAPQETAFDLTGASLTFSVPAETSALCETILWTNSTCIRVMAEDAATGTVYLYNTTDLTQPILQKELTPTDREVLFSNLTSATTYRVSAQLNTASVLTISDG